MDAKEIKDKFDKDVSEDDFSVLMTSGLQGAIIGTLEKAAGGKENRKLILKYLTGHTSSKELNISQWRALYNLVQPFKPEGGKWTSANFELDQMCGILLAATYDQPGQQKMEFHEFNEFEKVELDPEKPWIDQIGATDNFKEGIV